MLITFEGIDGCGKSTQAALLAERLKLQGIVTKLLREPGGTELSEQVRTLLLNKSYAHPLASETELLLFAASRAQLMHEVILPALARNEIVILDRFTDSTIAYQGYGRGISIPYIKQINRFASADTEPDLTFYFDVSLDVASSRREASGKDRIESESEIFFNRVIKGYEALASEHTERIVALDGSMDIDEIRHNIWRLLEEMHGNNLNASARIDQ